MKTQNSKTAKKIKSILVMSVYALPLGAVAGLVVWLVLKVINLGIEFLWTYLPEKTGHEVIYTFAVCIMGGIIIGLFQKRYGLLPDKLETVMATLKRDGTYPYDRLHILAIAAILPLIFGASLGPEAGLTGLITGLCCWIGDKLKIKGEELRELSEAGMAAVLGIIFNAPVFGFANNFEHSRAENKRYFSAKEFKLAKTIIYICGIAGGFGVMLLLGKLVGGGGGLPRFALEEKLVLADWKFFVIFAAAGIACGMLYMLFDLLSAKLAARIDKYRVTSCVIAGIALALVGLLLPLTMFSGEHQLGDIMENAGEMSLLVLILTPILKIFITNVCINFGWRGGNIFPVIFSGVSMGYALAFLTGVNPLFAVASTTAGCCGYIMRKPLTVVAVLFLCFPIRLIVPLLLAAYIASLIPAVNTFGSSDSKQADRKKGARRQRHDRKKGTRQQQDDR